MADLASDVLGAKAFLLQKGTSGRSVYDHLSGVLAALLSERPDNAIDILEDISAKIKADAQAPTSSIREQPGDTPLLKLARVQTALFQQDTGDDDAAETAVVQNVMESAQFFADGGVGVGQEETMRIYLALVSLSKQQPLKSVRFWGKIWGVEKNYIIAECEYKDGEEPPPPPEETENIVSAEEANEQDQVGEGGEVPLPTSQHVAATPVPTEDYGTGANKKVYFVCNEPGEPWVRLPHVAPKHITVARQIKKFLTGRLETPVHSYPVFPGTEANYLRAQIACISADTHVSPIGYFMFDEEAAEADEDEGQVFFVRNEDFEPKLKEELLDRSLSGWVHHVQHILPQGRCKWVNPNPPREEEDDDEEGQDEEQPEEAEPETGPALLSPLQNDGDVDGAPAWTLQLACPLLGAFSCVLASSNKWPGAHAYSTAAKFDNIYIGWGHPFSAHPYNPPMPPFPQLEFQVDETISETSDPTREEEIAIEASRREQGDQDDQADEEEAEEEED